MNQEITVKELFKETLELQKLFSQLEGKPWTVEAFVVELLAEAGTLADSIMIQEGYRKLRSEQDKIDLEDDICDILFVLLMIADYYKIDIGQAYLSMISSTRKKLEAKIKGLT
jgi:NTP pyrophosphatase (non-canonical NTP hydrolase)